MRATMHHLVNAGSRALGFVSTLPSRLVSASTGVLMTAGIAWLVVMAPPMPAPSSPQPEPATTGSAQSPAPLTTASTPTIPDPPPPSTLPDASAADTLLLRVETKPQGATIILDGQKLGITPFTVGRVKTGYHALRLEMDQYSPVSFDLELNEDTVVDLTLDTLPTPPPPPTALRKPRNEEETDSATTTEPSASKEVVASLSTAVTSDARASDAPPEPQTKPAPTESERRQKQQENQKRQQEEATWLKEAARHLKADRLTRPKGNNAQELYRKLLESDTLRPEAEAGLRQVAARLLALGQADLEAWRLVQPKEGNALERFRAVLSLDDDNAEAKAGLEEIVDRFLSLAQRYANDPDKAREYLQQAESVLPDSARITEIRSSLLRQAGQSPKTDSHAPSATAPN
ncbi:MAG: PEGA domain-containing protein [Magnetococcales bacterium]|nr:PEGA domain-containing protein [Magnetococcales bacterium]